MNLSAETCLRGVIDTLNTRVAPVLPAGYAAEVTRLASLVLAIATNSLDDAAALRVAENEAMRQLFRDAAPMVADAGLAGRLRAGANTAGSGLKISELDADNAYLRGLLVELHSHADDLPGAAPAAIASRIWRMLRDFETARAPRR